MTTIVISMTVIYVLTLGIIVGLAWHLLARSEEERKAAQSLLAARTPFEVQVLTDNIEVPVHAPTQATPSAITADLPDGWTMVTS